MQKITNIEIKNFKSIRQAEIKDCRKVNVFVGPPNVGKSNILEALGLFGFNEDIKLKDLFRVKEETTLFFNGEIGNDFFVTINEKLEIKGSYFDNHLYFNYNYFEQDRNKKVENINSANFKEYKFSNYELVDFINTGTQEDRLRGYYFGKDFSIKKYEFNKNFKKQNGKYSSLIYPFGNNIFSIISSNQKIYTDVANLFKPYNLELLFDSRNLEYSILKRTDKGIFSLPYELIADTLQRLVFHKTAIASNKNSAVLFEEPEAHMFPPYISKFTSDIIQDENNNQYFIATHSAFVLNDFMEEMDKEDLAIYVVGLKDGATTIKKLSDEEITEVYQYGVDLFFNLEDYLQDAIS